MAQTRKAKDAAVASMKADGIEYEERMALLEEISLSQAAGGAAAPGARAVPRDPPVGAGVRPLPQVGRARHVRVGPDVHRVHRLLRDRARRGPRPALPVRHLPRAAPDRAGPRQDRRARRHRGVARRDRAPGRLQPARRVGGADRPGVGGPRRRGRRRRRADRPAAPDHRQRARVPRHGPQRDVPARPARRARPLRRPRRARERPARQGRDERRTPGRRRSAPTGTSTRRWATGPPRARRSC